MSATKIDAESVAELNMKAGGIVGQVRQKIRQRFMEAIRTKGGGSLADDFQHMAEGDVATRAAWMRNQCDETLVNIADAAAVVYTEEIAALAMTLSSIVQKK